MSLPLADDEEKGKRFSCGCPEYISPSRNYGIDALRIVAMMMVLILHLLASIDVLITGYVCCDGTFRYERVVSLWFQVVFYTWGSLLLALLFFPRRFS